MAKKKKENEAFEFEWDPIKYAKDGKQAQAVIWSTNVLNAAVDGLTKGLPLKANPFIGKDTQLLKPELVFRRTKEEIEDAEKCMEDPVFFASKCFLMTPEGLQACVLRDYQIDYLRHVQNNRFSIFCSCRQSGKTFLQNSKVSISLPINYVNNNGKKLLKNINYILEKYSYIKDNKYYCINDIPIYEIIHIFDKSFIGNIRYKLYKTIDKIFAINKSKKISPFRKIYKLIFSKLEIDRKIIELLISILDFIDYTIIKQKKLTDNYKTISEFKVNNDILIKTDTGYKPISDLYISKPFKIWTVELENGYMLDCADEHRLFDENMNDVFLNDLHIGDSIQTDEGPKKIISIDKRHTKVCMADLQIDDNNHRFYTNNILSHNSTTTAIYCVWMAVFHPDKSCLVLSKSAPAGIDLIKKIQDIYRFLPYHLKPGIIKFNQSAIAFDNNSQISTEPFSPTAGLGKTINFLILDEFAWCPPNDVELFYNNIIPTITTITNSNVCIMSTQNGRNFFYQLWTAAEQHKNVYAPFKVDWWQVPQYNPETKIWEKRDEKWKEMMVGVLGSEQAFYYQYGTMFLSSDKCLISRETLSKLRDNTYLFTPIEKLPYPMNYFSMYKQYLYFDAQFNTGLLKNEFFILLIDLAEGGGGDYTIFNILQVIDKDKFKQVGYWRCNNVDIEQAALEFWVMYVQLFNSEKCLVSIEWNTYGALFYNYITQLNETDYRIEWQWRFNVSMNAEFDILSLAYYKKGSQEEEIAGVNGQRFKTTIPGIRFSSSNKKSACALLKMMIEREQIAITDLVTISELENFEDINGNGSYAASYGHDDLVMTLCQLPMLINTAKYKEFIEEYQSFHMADMLLQQSQSLNPMNMSSFAPQINQDMNVFANDYFMPIGMQTMGYQNDMMDEDNYYSMPNLMY